MLGFRWIDFTSIRDDILRLFVSSQSQEDRLRKQAVTSTGLTQWQLFMTAGVIARPHLPGVFSGKLINGHDGTVSF
jgi:hypothetical protein